MERTFANQVAVVIVAAVCWVIAQFSPVDALPPVVVTAALFCGIVGWSAIRYRRSGWLLGLVFMLFVVAMIADLGMLAWYVWYARLAAF